MAGAVKSSLFRTRTRRVCLFTLLLLLQMVRVYSQNSANLVTNGGFEISNSGQTNAYEAARYWSAIDSGQAFSHKLYSVKAPFSNAPNSSFGYQFPRSANNFIGSTFFYGDAAQGYPAYPRNRLKSELKKNTVYCGKYYVVNTNNSPYAIDRFEMVFSDGSIDTICQSQQPLTYLTPVVENQTGNVITDTLNWSPISGTFAAQGNEKYLLLGNFHSVANTSTLMVNPTYSDMILCDIYIDDVSCIELELPAYAGPDMSIRPGDSVFIGRESDIEIDESCQWFQLPNPTVPIDTVAGLWVKPTVKTTYVVRQQLWCSGVKWDTVTIHINNVGLDEHDAASSRLTIHPNPVDDELTITSELEMPIFHVYNMMGQLMDVSMVRNSITEHTLNTRDLPSGVYFLNVRSKAPSNKWFIVAH